MYPVRVEVSAAHSFSAGAGKKGPRFSQVGLSGEEQLLSVWLGCPFPGPVLREQAFVGAFFWSVPMGIYWWLAPLASSQGNTWWKEKPVDLAHVLPRSLTILPPSLHLSESPALIYAQWPGFSLCLVGGIRKISSEDLIVNKHVYLFSPSLLM